MPAASRSRPRAQVAVARRPRALPSARSLATQAFRIAPSWRSLAVGVVLLALAFAMYLVARGTSVFAVRTVEVTGAPPALAKEIRVALAPLAGKSLLEVDGNDVQRHLGKLPNVAAASYDRAFPHTLRVFVRAEQPLAVLRVGARGWLVSAAGRVLRDLPHPGLSSLPRIWLSRSASVSEAATLADDQGVRAVAVLAEFRTMPLGSPVRDVVEGEGGLTLLLRSGLEVRLGDASKLRVKLAVARRILPLLTAPGYLDVSVPVRAVTTGHSQVEG
jgi:cell division protein FtsQ